MKPLLSVGNRLFAQTTDTGALPQLYAATAPGRRRAGSSTGRTGSREQRGHPTVVKPVASATDPETARKLWDLSEELTGVRYPL